MPFRSTKKARESNTNSISSMRPVMQFKGIPNKQFDPAQNTKKADIQGNTKIAGDLKVTGKITSANLSVCDPACNPANQPLKFDTSCGALYSKHEDCGSIVACGNIKTTLGHMVINKGDICLHEDESDTHGRILQAVNTDVSFGFTTVGQVDLQNYINTTSNLNATGNDSNRNALCSHYGGIEQMDHNSNIKFSAKNIDFSNADSSFNVSSKYIDFSNTSADARFTCWPQAQFHNGLSLSGNFIQYWGDIIDLNGTTAVNKLQILMSDPTVDNSSNPGLLIGRAGSDVCANSMEVWNDINHWYAGNHGFGNYLDLSISEVNESWKTNLAFAIDNSAHDTDPYNLFYKGATNRSGHVRALRGITAWGPGNPSTFSNISYKHDVSGTALQAYGYVNISGSFGVGQWDNNSQNHYFYIDGPTGNTDISGTLDVSNQGTFYADVSINRDLWVGINRSI